MPVVSQMTAVRSKRDAMVHVTSLTSPNKTACGRRCKGWAVAKLAKSHVGCSRCKAAIYMRVQVRK